MSNRSRRAFGLALVAALAGRYSGAFAQAKPLRVGVLTIDNPAKRPLADWVGAAREALAREGWIEGKTVIFVARDARGSPTGFAEAATDLARQKVDAILCISASAIRAASKATQSIPVVGSDYTNDPIAAGYAKSYSRPGGNVTGVFLDGPGFAAKWFELLRESVPGLTRVVALWDPTPGDTHMRALKALAPNLGIQMQVVQVNKPEDIDAAGAAFANNPQAIIVVPSPMLYVQNTRLVNLAMKQRLPATSMAPAFAEAGGLLAYGPNDRLTSERMGSMLAKVLRGAKVGDLPIERPVTFDLVVNLEAAKQLNLRIPEAVLLRADRVIR